MKIVVTMKDPDAVYEQVQEEVEKSLRIMGISEDEIGALVEGRCEKQNQLLKKWVKYGEYISIEFDTEAMTATVLGSETI